MHFKIWERYIEEIAKEATADVILVGFSSWVRSQACTFIRVDILGFVMTTVFSLQLRGFIYNYHSNLLKYCRSNEINGDQKKSRMRKKSIETTVDLWHREQTADSRLSQNNDESYVY